MKRRGFFGAVVGMLMAVVAGTAEATKSIKWSSEPFPADEVRVDVLVADIADASNNHEGLIWKRIRFDDIQKGDLVKFGSDPTGKVFEITEAPHYDRHHRTTTVGTEPFPKDKDRYTRRVTQRVMDVWRRRSDLSLMWNPIVT